MLWAPMVFGIPGVQQWKATWDANTDEDLAGYYLYWRTTDSVFTDTNKIDCQLYTSHSLTDIPGNTILALTAYDTSNNESEYSTEVPFTVDSIPPVAPGGLSITKD